MEAPLCLWQHSKYQVLRKAEGQYKVENIIFKFVGFANCFVGLEDI